MITFSFREIAIAYNQAAAGGDEGWAPQRYRLGQR